MHSAADYLREVSNAITDSYPRDCVAHACRIAELLLAEGRAPWIGRIRDETRRGDRIELGPLIPKRLAGRGRSTVAWTTHYVACSGLDAYDPLVGAPVSLVDLALRLFGRDLMVDVHTDAAETRQLLERGELRKAFPPHVRL